MKKTALFMACCIGLMLLASCKKDTKPTLTVVTDPGYVSQNSEVFSGDQLLVGFNAAGESLIQIMMIAEQNGNAIFTHSETLENVASYSYTKTFTLDVTGTVTIRGTVTDAKGNTATKSFDIHMNEKPNAKFVGRYEGNILLSGDANIESALGNYAEPLENYACPTIVEIEPGESIIEVVATITINEQSNTMRGTVEGNKVTFEALSSLFDFNYMNFTISLNMTYSITGLLNGDQLDLEGTCSGNGSNMLGTIELENGTLGGSLNKTR